MALIKCPYCEQSISDSATQCPHCQKQLVTAKQHKRNNLIAMLLSVVAVIIYLLFTMIASFYNRELFTPGCVESFSLMFITLAWIIWLIRKKKNDYAAKVGVVICIGLFCVYTFLFVDFFFYFLEFDLELDSALLKNIYAVIDLVCAIVSIAFGITLFFLKDDGKIKRIITVVGLLYVIFYLMEVILITTYLCYEKVPQLASAVRSLPYKITYHSIYYLMLIAVVVLFVCLFIQAIKEKLIKMII